MVTVNELRNIIKDIDGNTEIYIRFTNSYDEKGTSNGTSDVELEYNEWNLNFNVMI